MRILLVAMPAASVRPSVGLGLLKAELTADGHDVSVYYATIDFAARVTPEFYHWISEVAPVEALVGEWLFSSCLFGDAAVDPEEYLTRMARAFPDELPAEVLARLREVRGTAEAFIERCRARITAEHWDAVGFSTSFSQNIASLALAERIKKDRPATHILFGGANCDDAMGLALHRAFGFLDLVFTGEADVSLPAALRELHEEGRVRTVPGVVWRTDDGGSGYRSLSPQRVQNLDLLPVPDYADFFRQYRRLPPGSRTAGVPVETSRGCWWGEKHHCTFCGLNGLAMAYRAKSPERALEEFDHVQSTYMVRDLQVVDNILDTRYFTTLLPELAARRHKPALFYETKANLSRRQVQVLADAGVKAIQPGIESLDSGVLRLMDKGTTGMQNIELLRSCREAGIWPHWNILFGFPGESPDAYQRMADLVPALVHLDPPNVCTQLRLDRFSPLFRDALQAGILNLRPHPAYRLVYRLDGAALANLAFYFSFDYLDGRRPERYARGLIEAVGRWQRIAGTRDFRYERAGGTVVLRDERFGEAVEHELTGWRAALYAYCSASRSERALAAWRTQHDVAEDDLASCLDAWSEQHLILRLDGRTVALAVDGPAVRRHRRRKPTWQDVRERSSSRQNSPAAGTGTGRQLKAGAT